MGRSAKRRSGEREQRANVEWQPRIPQGWDHGSEDRIDLGKKRAPGRLPRRIRRREHPGALFERRDADWSVDDGHAAAVLGPGLLVRADHRRTLLAVGDG